MQELAFNIPVIGPVWSQKAEEIVLEVNIEFTPSRGWLDEFRKHGRISLLLRSGKFCFRFVWRTKQTMLDMFFKKENISEQTV
jgi:hypothetical protein